MILEELEKQIDVQELFDEVTTLAETETMMFSLGEKEFQVKRVK